MVQAPGIFVTRLATPKQMTRMTHTPAGEMTPRVYAAMQQSFCQLSWRGRGEGRAINVSVSMGTQTIFYFL